MGRDGLGLRLIRWCLALLPSEAREEYASEIAELARRRAEELEGASRSAIALFWFREVSSVLVAVWTAHADRVRDGTGSSWLFDFRTLLRGLLARPLFTGVTVLLLGLGVGSTAGIAGLGWTILGAPLPYPDADRLVRLFHDADLTFGVSPSELLYYREESRTLAELAGWVVRGATLEVEGRSERVVAARVTPNLLAVLGRRPAHGRDFDPEGAAAEVMLSHRFWSGRFGTDPGVLGRTIRLDDDPHAVVGVLPSDASFPDPSVDVYLPVDVGAAAGEGRGGPFMDVVGRLAPGTELREADAEVDVLAGALRRADPGAYEAEDDFGGHLAPFRSVHVRSDRPLLIALGLGAAILLVATCLTVTLLLRARARRREGEMAVRRALGATAAALRRLRLTELLVLTLGGAVAGAFGAALVGRGISTLVPGGVALTGTGPLEATLPAVPVVAGAAALLLTLMVLPRSGGGDVGPRAAHTSTRRLGAARSVLPGAQTALALMLLGASLLLVRTVRELVSTDLGYRVDGVLSGRVSLSSARHPTPEERSAFFGRVLERLRRDPFVDGAGLVSALPLSGYGGSGDVYVRSISPDSALDVVTQRIADAAYFDAAGVPLMAGRLFDSDDRPGSPRVALVDEVFARRYFGEARRAVGERIRFFFGGEEWNEIVGVVGHVRHSGPTARPGGQVYVSFAQRSERSMHVVVAHTGPAGRATASVRRAVAEVDPSVPVYDVASMEERLRGTLQSERAALVLFTAFGALSLLLAVAGTYGVVALAQEERLREIAVRRALGAPSRAIVHTVAADGLVALGGGTVVGVGGGLVTGLVLERLLGTVQGGHGTALAGAAALVLVTGVLAALAPVRRALTTAPGRIMRGR